jgi:amidase
MDRRRFLRHSLLALPAVRAVTGQSLRLEETTLAELARGFRENRFTARSVAEWYLARIDALDRKGPAVNAVIEINPEALALADALDAERRSKGARGPLHGVPVLIKTTSTRPTG